MFPMSPSVETNPQPSDIWWDALTIELPEVRVLRLSLSNKQFILKLPSCESFHIYFVQNYEIQILKA